MLQFHGALNSARLTGFAVKLLACVAVVMALSACATSNVVSSNSPAQASHAHIGGEFLTEMRGLTTAFIFTNLDDKTEYVLPFATARLYGEGHSETVMIKVPPGNYRISDWTVFGAMLGSASREFTTPMKESALSKPFAVKAGEVVFVGRFASFNVWSRGALTSKTMGEWRRLRFTDEEARRAVQDRFPAFATHPLRCMACDEAMMSVPAK